MATVQLDRNDGIGILRLDNGVTNALSPALVTDLTTAINDLGVESTIKGIVLTSANEKFFSIGLALPELISLTPEEYRPFHSSFNRLCLALYSVPKPVVAAITGHAIAGGCVLALCCDYRFIASGRTLMGLNEIKLGVPVPYVADCVLRDTIGSRRARSLVEEGDFYPPEELQRIGLVDRVIPAADLVAESVCQARKLGAMPPAAFALIKRNRTAPVLERIHAGLAEREARFVDCWFAPDTRARMREALATFRR